MNTPHKKLTVGEEFKRFINRGSVIDVGVAFVMGAAFKTVVDAFAGDGKKNQGILGGLVGALFGGNRPNFNDKGITLNGRFCSSQPEESTNELLASIRDELRQQR